MDALTMLQMMNVFYGVPAARNSSMSLSITSHLNWTD